MGNLVIFKSSIPIKAIPEQELNKVILTDFLTWISGLLSLTDEVSANRLEIALPAIKQHCWSMGFDEIKKMFEMYVDNKLSIKPIPNYFDRILLGKIVDSYKEQRPRKKPKMEDIPDEEKKSLTSSGIKKCLECYEEKEQILDGYNLFLYDVFYDDGYLPKDNETKNKAIEDAKQFLELNYVNRKSKSKDDYDNIKKVLKELKKPKSTLVIVKAKEMIVSKFLRELYKSESKVIELKKRYKCV